MSFSEALPSSRFSIDIGGYDVTHQLTGELGKVTLVGQCLATHHEFEAAANRALAQGSIAPLDDLAGAYTTIMSRGQEQVVAVDLAGQFRLPLRETDKSNRAVSNKDSFDDLVDKAYLASYILDFPELTTGRTALRRVRRLEGGQIARFVAERLVSLEDTGIQPDLAVGLSDAAYDLRRELVDAVRRRVELDKVVTSEFSGGYDSSTLGLLAADLLPQGIDAFINYQSGQSVGDLPFAQAIARTHPAIRLHARPEGRDVLPYTDMLEQSGLDVSPHIWMVSNVKFANYLSELQSYGSQIHLSGEGGDSIFSPPSNFLAGLVRQNDLKRLRWFAQASGRLRDIDPRRVYDKALYDEHRTRIDDLRDIVDRLRNPDNGTMPFRYTWYALADSHMSFLTASIRQHLSERAEQLAAERFEQPNEDLANATSLAELRVSGESQYYPQRQARDFGIAVHAPYLDSRVIKAALQAPAHVRAHPESFKYILQEAFRGMLPDILLTRNSKSIFNGEDYRGLRASWDNVTSLLTKDCRLADLGIIEPTQVIQELYSLNTGRQGRLYGVRLIIAAEVWLRLLEGNKQ
jgi:asparagine synthase (glutamine-hydrolysing)